MAENDWQAEDGSGREPFEATILTAYWKEPRRAEFGSTAILVLGDGSGNWTRQCELSSGKGWRIGGSSEVVERADGRSDARFHARSWVGRLVTWAASVPDLHGILVKRGSPRQANVWLDLRFRFEEVAVDFGENVGVKRRVMPVRFLGEDSLGHESESRESLVVARTQQSDELPFGPVADGPLSARGIPPTVLEDLTAAARAATRHEDFVVSGVEILEGARLRALIVRVVQDGPGSLWRELSGQRQ